MNTFVTSTENFFSDARGYHHRDIPKLESLRLARDDARAIVNPLRDQALNLLHEIQQADAFIRARAQALRFDPTNDAFSPDRNKITIMSDERARLQALIEPRAARADSLSRLVSRCEKFLIELNRRGIALAFSEPTSPSQGKSPATTLEKIRARLLTVDVEIARIREAPYPRSEIKTKFREQISTLAKRGAPNFQSAIAHLEYARFPEITSELLHGGPIVPVRVATPQGLLNGEAGPIPNPYVDDTLGILSWALGDALIARGEREIDALTKESESIAIGSVDRRERLTSLQSERFSLEQVEEATITAAEDDGQFLSRREDADARALLGLAASMPDECDLYDHAI